MTYFVSVTYDLEYAKTSDYPKVKAELENLDFSKVISGRKKNEVSLPSNTFVAEFDADEFDKTKDAAEWVSIEFKKITTRLGLSGKFFVSAGRNWAWKLGSF